MAKDLITAHSSSATGGETVNNNIASNSYFSSLIYSKTMMSPELSNSIASVPHLLVYSTFTTISPGGPKMVEQDE